jgi:hypothetical protein
MCARSSFNGLGSTVCGLAVLALATGCDLLELAPLVTARSTLSEEFQTNSKPRVVIDTFNGTIDVSDSAGDEVVVEVTKRASGLNQEAAESNLNLVEVSIVQKDDTIVVKARRLVRTGNCGADVVVAVPKSAHLTLKSSNGYIVCEGLNGPIGAATSNGKVTVVEATGQIDVQTSNGAIEIEAERAAVQARTSNGSIAFAGTLAQGENKFRTSNGSVQLRLPEDSQFKFDCSTSNARARCEFPNAETTKRSSKRKLSGRVGDDPQISIVAQSSNGSVTIRPLEARSSDDDSDDDN